MNLINIFIVLPIHFSFSFFFLGERRGLREARSEAAVDEGEDSRGDDDAKGRRQTTRTL